MPIMKTSLVLTWAFSLLVGGGAFASPAENPKAAATGERITFDKPLTKGRLSLEETLWLRRSVRSFSDQKLTWEQIGQLLWAAQGVNRPESGGRTSPSAGATYPLETYVVVSDGIYKYLPKEHAVQKTVSGEMRQILKEAGLGPEAAQESPCVMIFTAVFERTVSRFGKDAYPYIYLEAGHVAQNVLLEVTALGLGAVPNGTILGFTSKKPLGLPPEEDPVYVLVIGYPKEKN